MPTEELFGAYHFLLEVAATSEKLKAAGVDLTKHGLDQAMRGQVITNPRDRMEIAKLLARTANGKASAARA